MASASPSWQVNSSLSMVPLPSVSKTPAPKGMGRWKNEGCREEARRRAERVDAAGGQRGGRRMLAGLASTEREGPRTPDRGDDAAHLVQLVAVFRQPEGLDQRTHDLGLL